MDVKVYSTPTCPWCKRTKEFLDKNGVEYEDVNVSGNQEAAQEMVKKSKQMGVPVVDVDGTIVVGYDEDALRKALNLN